MTIRTRPVTKEYAEGWERTFGEARRAKEALVREIHAEVMREVAREMNRPHPMLDYVTRKAK
jgi:hypothetical protein